MDTTLRPTQWIEQCALVLRERWQTVAPEQLEEVAVGIWNDERLRAMPPTEAATTWLAPVAAATASSSIGHTLKPPDNPAYFHANGTPKKVWEWPPAGTK